MAVVYTSGTSDNTFQGVSSIASSSAPSEQPPFDAFINHRGPDVKSTLASSIYEALAFAKLKAFLDQKELQLGELIPQAIESAMRTARTHIAIFSENYVSSPWCLAELSCMLKTEAPILPVFYNVEPMDFKRVKRGKYADVFSKHEERYSQEKIGEWENALEIVASLSGCILKANRVEDERSLIRKVVDRVRREIGKVDVPFEEPRHAVGLDKAIEDFETFLKSSQAHQRVQIVGIVGTGGCGKSTLARKFCNLRYSMFDRYSFLSEVRKSALPNLLRKLLGELLLTDISLLKDASELKPILAGRLRNLPRRFLIVLDDVDELDQLNDLLPDEVKSLGSGSLIIVTARNPSVLQSWGISIYEMKALDTCHAKELFCWHAFSETSPPAAFEDLVQDFLVASNRLPLFIEVIAGTLHKKPEEQWRSKLKKIPILNTKEIKKLRPIIYDALDKEEKYIFLDVACFFVGEKKSLAVALWEADDRNGLESLEGLVNKCLVEVDKQNRLRMNDILRDLGRQIAIESLPHRLWSQNHITRIIEGTEPKGLVIRGINAATTKIFSHSGRYELPECCDSYRLPFKEWSISGPQILLQLLLVHGNYFTQDFSKLSVGLLWLRCFDFQDEKLPSCLSLTNLRILELYDASSLKDLWENNVDAPKELREMIITARKGNILDRFPSNIAGLVHLTKIALISYHGDEFRFETLPEEFCDLQSLEHLELRHCKLLSDLPSRFGALIKLRHLDLCCCETLRNLPDSFKELAKLEYLDLSGCVKLDPAPDILLTIKHLKNLHFSGCPKLQHLPLQIVEQKSLRELHLKNTMLMEVPNEIDQLSKLEILVIGSPCLTDFPPSFLNLSSLTRLKIVSCAELKSLPESKDCFQLLEYLVIKACRNMKSLPEWLMRLSNLQSLKIIDCPITELDFGYGASSSMCKLKVIQIRGTDVESISFSQGCCSNLEILQLQQNEELMELVNVPKSVKMVELDAQNSVKKVYRYERRSKRQKVSESIAVHNAEDA